MSFISIQQLTEGKGIPHPWLERLLQFSEQVRHKAFDLFEESGRPHGHDVNHWLEAERQLISVPRYELLETASEIDVRIEIPGFDAEEIEIIALPEALLVKAEAGPEHEKREGVVRYTEFDDRSLFRRIALPTPIDVTGATARLDRGILSIAAPKAPAEAESECQVCQAGAQ